MKNKIPLFVWIVLSISILIIAASVSYYFVKYLPSKEKSESQTEQMESVKEKDEVQIRQDCRDEALTKAQDKLKKLMDAGLVSSSEEEDYKKALEQGLAKKDDIDYYFDICLEINGLK